MKWDIQKKSTRLLCAVLYRNLCCYIGPLLFLLLFLVLSLEILVKQGICLHSSENGKECRAATRNNLFYLQLARHNILAFWTGLYLAMCKLCLKCLNKSPYRVWEMIEISHKIIYLYCTDWSKLCLFYLGQFNQMPLNMLGRIK